MRVRHLVSAALVAGFIGIVVQAAVANQCPASELGACARIHLQIMRSRVTPPAAVLAAVPMRAVDARRG